MEKNDDKKERRSLRTIIIDKKLQKKYFLFSIAFIFAIVAIIMLTVYVTVLFILKNADFDYYSASVVVKMLKWLNICLIVEGVIFIVIAGLVSLRISHKVAGPLARLQKLLKEQIDGQPFEIKIRKNDDLHDFVDVLNELIKKKIMKK